MKTHGEARSTVERAAEYKVWSNIKTRCFNSRATAFERYGGRGITMCPEWVASYPAFLAAVGRRPSPDHSIDRIRGEEGYIPGNVRWATRTQQARNRLHLKPLVINGESKLMSEWSEVSGTPIKMIWERYTLQGWSAERSVFTPIQPSRPTHCRRGHLFGPENTRWEGKSRRCTTCKTAYDKVYQRQLTARGIVLPADEGEETE